MEMLAKRTPMNQPVIQCNPAGLLVIEGKAICLQCEQIFEPVIDWCAQLTISEAYILIKLEHLNMASMRQLLRVFSSLIDNQYVEKINANWYYHFENSDIQEKGKILEDLYPSVNFHFNRLFIRSRTK